MTVSFMYMRLYVFIGDWMYDTDIRIGRGVKLVL